MTQTTLQTRKAVGALLLAQDALEKDIRAAVYPHIAEASAEAAKRHGDERRALTLGLLLLGAKAMATDVRTAIVDGRAAARARARGRLVAELGAAGIIIGAHEWQPSHRSEEDDAHAASSADSLASQWRQLAIAAVLLSRRKDAPASKAIAATRGSMVARIERTASTEAAQGYNDERRAAMGSLIRFDRTYRDGDLADRIESTVGRRWSALVDACEKCEPMDGVIVGMSDSFPGDEEPGYVHARCRCIEEIVSLEATTRRAA